MSQSRFHMVATAISQVQDILRSESSLEDKLMKLNGLMHTGETLIYTDKSLVSQELSVFIPRFAALAVDKTNASDSLIKNVLWQMLTQIVILNDLLVTSEETFLSFVSTLFQLGFNTDLPWLLREGMLGCLTELETTYPGLLVRALPRIYRTIVFEKTPAIQAYLSLFAVAMNHCFVLSYDIALDDLRQEMSTITPNRSPQKNKAEGVKISFKYVVSYKVFKQTELGTKQGDFMNKIGELQLLTVLKERLKLCSSVGHAFIRQQLLGLELGTTTPSNNLLNLFEYCASNISDSSSLGLLANSDFLSPSFKHMLLSWYLSFISSQPSSTTIKTSSDIVCRAAFCNTFDISFKQLVSASLRLQSSEFISSFLSFSSTGSDSLLAILRYLFIANECKNNHLVQSLSVLFVSHMFRSRSDYSSAINSMTCEALDGFKGVPNANLVIESLSRQLEAFCLKNEPHKNRRVARLLGDFLPIFSKLAFLRLDFDKQYLIILCDLMTSTEKKRFGLTMEKIANFLNFLCSFLAMTPQYVVKNELAKNEKMLANLKELEIDIAKLTVMLISYCSTKTKVVPCSEKFLVTPKFRMMESNELRWSVSLLPMYEYSSLDIPVPAKSQVESLSELFKLFSQQLESGDVTSSSPDMRFLLTLNDAALDVNSKDRLCFALSIELFALSCFLNIDRKMVASYGLPVVDFASVAADGGKLTFHVKLEGLSAKQPYHEKLIPRVSFSTGGSNIYASWLQPLGIKLTDVLVPLRLVAAGDEPAESVVDSLLLGEQFVTSLSDEVNRFDESLGWIDSIVRTNATSDKIFDSAFKKFILYQNDEFCLVGGLVPPSSLLLINFRYPPKSPLTPSGGAPMTFSPDDEADNKMKLRDFLNKYNNCCFAFIYTNNVLLLRHAYLLLESAFS